MQRKYRLLRRNLFGDFEWFEVLKEMTGGKRGKMYAFEDDLQLCG